MTRNALILFVAALVAGCGSEAPVERVLERARKYEKLGELDKAKVEYIGALRRDPANADALRSLGLVWFQQGSMLRAAPLLSEALRLDSNDEVSRKRLAEIHLSVNGKSDAYREVLTVLTEDPGDKEALLLLARAATLPDEIAEVQSRIAVSGSGCVIVQAVLALKEGSASSALDILSKGGPEGELETAEYHLVRGHAELQIGRHDEAKHSFARAAELSSPRSSSRMALAEYLGSTGDLSGAKLELERVAGEAPDYLPAMIALAKVHLRSKEPAKARDWLEKVKGRDPLNLEARLLEVELILGEGIAGEAVERSKSLTVDYPKFPSVHFALARAHILNANPSLAVHALEEVLILAPNDQEARVMLAGVRLQLGQFAAATRDLEDIVEKSPQLFRAQILLAQAYQSAGRYTEAEKILTAQLQQDASHAETHILLGVVLRHMQQPVEARAAIEKGLELDPTNFLGLVQLTELAVDTADLKPILGRLEEQLAKSPESAGLLYLIGRVQTELDNWPAAKVALQSAIERAPDLAVAYETLVEGYVKQGDLDEAANRMNEFLARHPENVPARIVLAMIREQQGDSTHAAQAYENVLSIEPNNPIALNNLAWMLADNGTDFDRALEYSRKARTLYPTNASIADTLGWIHFLRKEYPSAHRVLSEAAALAPDQPNINYKSLRKLLR